MVQKIGYICAPEQVEHVETAFLGYDTLNLGGKADMRETVNGSLNVCDLLFVFDGSLSDDDVCKIAQALYKVRDGIKKNLIARCKVPEMCFVGDALRDAKDPLYTRLRALGVCRMAGRTTEPDGEYSIYTKAAQLAMSRPTDLELARHVLSVEELRALDRKKSMEELNLFRERSKYGMDAPRGTQTVLVFQSKDKNGSTHVAIALARALRALNAYTALVLPPRHFEELKRLYPSAVGKQHGDEVAINLFGIIVYPGETAGVAMGGGFDYVVFDQGTAQWFMKSRGRTELERRQQENFDSAAVAVWSSFMSPTGGWGPGMKDGEGPSPIARFEKGRMKKVRMAVFGCEDDAALAIAAKAAAKASPAGIVRMETIPHPFSSAAEDVTMPECICELLSTGIIPRDAIRELQEIRRPPDIGPAGTEPAAEPEEAPRRRRLFGGAR